MPEEESPKKTRKATKITKRCPNCGATIFQGPVQRGPIVGDVHQVKETLYTCVNCHALKALHELDDYELPQ